MGDMTVHGGVITLGCPTVFIGGQPAARVSDLHVCPMFDGPKPHVGGPILPPGSPTVFIGGMPAARVSDMATCVGPPDAIAPPGCPTVFIGVAGAGSAGSPGAPGAAMAPTLSARSARIDAPDSRDLMDVLIGQALDGATVDWGALEQALLDLLSAQGQNKESETRAEHWIEFEFVENAGLPVSGVAYHFTDTESKESDGTLPANGTISRDGIPAGQGEVILRTLYNARWSKEMAKVGETVTMQADVDGFDAGTAAIFRVCKRDVQGPPVLIDTIVTQTEATSVKAEWVLAPPVPEKDPVVPPENAEDTDVEAEKYSAPDYFFEVLVDLCRARSGVLYIEDFIEIEACDEEDNPLKDEPYVLYISNGEVREGTLDGGGQTREDKIPSGMCNLRFTRIPEVEFEGPETNG